MGLIRGLVHGIGHAATWIGHEAESGAGHVSDAASASGRLFQDAYHGIGHVTSTAAKDVAGAVDTTWDHTAVSGWHGVEHGGAWVGHSAKHGASASADAVEALWRDTALAGFRGVEHAGGWVGHTAKSGAEGVWHGASTGVEALWKVIY